MLVADSYLQIVNFALAQIFLFLVKSTYQLAVEVLDSDEIYVKQKYLVFCTWHCAMCNLAMFG